MILFSEWMIVIPKEFLCLKIEVIRSRRNTSVLNIIGNKLQIRVPNRVETEKLLRFLKTKKDGLEIKQFNYKINL